MSLNEVQWVGTRKYEKGNRNVEKGLDLSEGVEGRQDGVGDEWGSGRTLVGEWEVQYQFVEPEVFRKWFRQGRKRTRVIWDLCKDTRIKNVTQQ